MAYQRYSGYQYETSPRKLQPEYEPMKNPYQKKKNSTKKVVNNNKKPENQKHIKPKIRLISYITIGFVILFAISYRNSLITENFNEKEQLKKDLSSIQKENEQLKVSIEKSLNLNSVEQSAKELLGMQKLDNSQKVYVSFPKKDYVEPASEEVVIDQQNVWEKLLQGFTKSVK